MNKKTITAALTKSAKKAIKRPVYRYQPLMVQVGTVSVIGRNVKQCVALTKCAKRLSDSTPTQIRSDVMSVYTGATNTKSAVESAKALAESTPPSIKFMGNSVKAGSVKKAVAIVAVMAAAGISVYVGKQWIKAKFSRGTTDNNKESLGALIPKDQSINEVRDESSLENYDDGQLIGKLIYLGDMVIMFSQFGVGKTVVTMNMAIDIAKGQTTKLIPCEKAPEPQTVFYYDGENDSDDYKKIFGTRQIECSNLHLIRNFFFKDYNEWLADVRNRLKDTTGDVTVILDNISCIMSTFSADTTRQLFNLHFKKIQNKEKSRHITFIVIAHANKQQDLMGSNNQFNFATSVLKLNPHGDKFINLEVIKDRKYGYMKGKSFLVEKKQDEDGFMYDEYVKVTDFISEVKKNTSKADNIPPETIREIKEFYQKGVPGRGYQSVISKFHLDTEYGIKDSKEVSRIIESPD